jgi:hypothetical protein
MGAIFPKRFPYEDQPYNENLYFPNAALARGYISGIQEAANRKTDQYAFNDIVSPQTFIRVPAKVNREGVNARNRREYPGNTKVN